MSAIDVERFCFFRVHKIRHAFSVKIPAKSESGAGTFAPDISTTNKDITTNFCRTLQNKCAYGMNLKKHFRTNSFWFMQMSVNKSVIQKIVDSPPFPLFLHKWRCSITWGSCHKCVFGSWYIKGWKLSNQAFLYNQCKKYAQICILIFHEKV